MTLNYYDTMYGTLGVQLVPVDLQCFVCEDHRSLRVYNGPDLFKVPQGYSLGLAPWVTFLP